MTTTEGAVTGSLKYSRVWAIAWPMIIANSSTPLLGLVDTAIIGNLGDAALIGAIAFGALIFNFVYWMFGFIRMGTTGLTAQAHGSGDTSETQNQLVRAGLLGAALGLVVILLQIPIFWLALNLLQGSERVESFAGDYLAIRIWGAPATLIAFAINGWFIGQQKTGFSLAIQLFMNVVNMVLDALFVLYFGWGVAGVALGTVIAEVTACLFGLGLVWYAGRGRLSWSNLAWQSVLSVEALRRLFGVNFDIFVRTFCLLLCFAWFTSTSGSFGDTTLAANHILLQFLSFSAFFLDGYAFASESLVGSAIGARNRQELRDAVRKSTVLAGVTAIALTLIFAVLGVPAIHTLTNVEAVAVQAEAFLAWAIISPLIAVWCFQLDGIFIGATATKDMRNMALVTTAIYFVLGPRLVSEFGNMGLWANFFIWYLLRAATLAWRYPALVRNAVLHPASAEAARG